MDAKSLLGHSSIVLPSNAYGHVLEQRQWSPLWAVYVFAPLDGDGGKNVLSDPTIVGLAARYGKTLARIVLRWHLDSGRSAIPKSVRPTRIAENVDVFDLKLAPDEVGAIDALDTGVRGGPDQDQVDMRAFDLSIPE